MAKDIIPENDYDTFILGLWEKVNLWGWGKFIPIDEFFEKFNVPDSSKLWNRVENNLIYYRANYVALFGLLLLIISFTSPIFAVLVLLITLLWIIPYVMVPHPFVIDQYRVTPCCIVAITAIFTLFVLFLNHHYSLPFILFYLVFALLTILHAVFRNDSLISRLKVNFNEKLKGKLHD